MNKEKRSNIIFIIIIGVIVLLALAFLLISKGLKSVPNNPDGTIGNTPGNILNSGYFCEDDGIVYFANSYDDNSLYSMNPDETNIKKLVQANTKYINAGGNYLYYYMSDSGNSTGLGFIRRVMGIYRCNKKGKRVTTISRDPSLDMILINNHLYYQHYDNKNAVTLYKTNTEGSKQQMVSKEIINPSGVYGDIIYFANQKDNHFLMILDTTDDSIIDFKNYNMWNPIRYENYIYFMDINNNYRLARYSLDNDSIEVLSQDRVDCFNLNNQYVYFQANDMEHPALKRVTLDGTVEEVIMEGNYTAINITSEYVYFRPFNQENITYKTPAYGSINVSEFDAAKNAIK